MHDAISAHPQTAVVIEDEYDIRMRQWVAHTTIRLDLDRMGREEACEAAKTLAQRYTGRVIRRMVGAANLPGYIRDLALRLDTFMQMVPDAETVQVKAGDLRDLLDYVKESRAHRDELQASNSRLHLKLQSKEGVSNAQDFHKRGGALSDFAGGLHRDIVRR